MDFDFKGDYLGWLNRNITQYRISDNIYRITLPYLDRNNDCTEIFVKIDADTYTLTDDGETINELEMSNFNIFSSEKRTAIFNRILAAHGIKKSPQNELYVQCSADELPQKKHMLSQCMLKISDMFYTVKSNAQSFFTEDVQTYLDEIDARYSPEVSFSGVSGLTTNYDFLIPKSKKAPERIIKVVNNIDQQQANSILFLWNDTKQARSVSSLLYIFMQDSNRKIAPSLITSIRNYDATPVPWSKRSLYVTNLAA